MPPDDSRNDPPEPPPASSDSRPGGTSAAEASSAAPEPARAPAPGPAGPSGPPAGVSAAGPPSGPGSAPQAAQEAARGVPREASPEAAQGPEPPDGAAPGEPAPPGWALGIRITAGLGAVIIVAVLLIQLKVVVLPAILAFLACCVLNPMVEVFHERWRLPRFLAMVLSLAVGVGLIWLTFNYILFCLNAFRDGYPEYAGKIVELVDVATAKAGARFDFITLPMIRDQLANISMGGVITWLLNYFMNLTWQLLLTILFTLYFLPGLPSLPQKLLFAFPGERGARLNRSVAIIISQVQRYVLAKTLMSLALGLVVTLVCLLFEVDFAGVWGVFAFFLNFIPNIGVPVAILPPALICLLQHDLAAAVKLLVILLAIEIYHGNWLEPRALGKSVDLSPTAALLAILVWGWLWGLIGTILAVPMMAVVQLTCQNIPGLRPVSRLIGN